MPQADQLLRRFGRSNPERLTNDSILWALNTAQSPDGIRAALAHPVGNGPLWTFDRVGFTRTVLDDGRVVTVGGEHEDHYHSDFAIYNDVVVEWPDGRKEIYGYPRELFPPIDFHTASSLTGSLILIGGLGYPSERKPAVCPVYRLDLDDYSITALQTDGESPGWIWEHAAHVVDDARAIVVDGGKTLDTDGQFGYNLSSWRLDVSTLVWTCAQRASVRQYRLTRSDGRWLHLSRLRSLATLSAARWAPEHKASMEDMIAKDRQSIINELGQLPDLSSLGQLYEPAIASRKLADMDNQHSIEIDDARVRYIEELNGVHVIVDSSLPGDAESAVLNDLKAKLGELERSAIHVVALR